MRKKEYHKKDFMSLLSKLYEMSKSFHVVKAIIKYEKTKLVFETNSEKRTFSFSAKAASEGLTVKENGLGWAVLGKWALNSLSHSFSGAGGPPEHFEPN